ncbi:GAP family protein [Nocardia sp. BSTN01]|uniref:GAP family protein n=1 Tax=Nocardia sp. BSTN01 TaxID=2783665 RepID=UPI00188E7205|nr:GAP family protein [Nocardia sp. BSTN01]MBF5001222.1 GAP family protein [Nocardia sp. BSTN01]
MGTVIGRTLPLAAAIAVSPLPLIVAVLMLVSGQARAKSSGYLLGRICGFAVLVAAVALLIGASAAEHLHPHHASTATSLIRLCCGIGLLGIAVWFGYQRTRGEEKPRKLWDRVDRVTPVGAFGLGVAFVIVDVSTLVPAVMGGLDIAEARLSAPRALGAGAIFLVIALASCIAPVAAYLVAGDRLDRPLATTKTWLVANDRTVMMVLLVLVGTMLIGRAIEALTSG